MNVISSILEHPLLREKPPVLCDIGASGHIHSAWKEIAPYAHCIAFDADDRELDFTEKQSSGFNRLLVYNCIATSGDEDSAEFFLTKSPFCSSLLKPKVHELAVWDFAEKFDVERTVIVKAKNISRVFAELGYDYVDWFKCDSQGTDLRLFNALPEQMRTRCIAVEIEPGIIDSYHSEDKLSSVLASLPQQGFWLADATIKGSRRMKPQTLKSFSNSGIIRKLISFSHAPSPGWIEMVYLNSFSSSDIGKREFLLGCLIGMLKKQYGFVFELAQSASERFNDSLFEHIKNDARKKMILSVVSLRFLPALFEKISKVLKLD